ncbi:PfkB family carbohydrate kinase [Aeromonas jandaei]|uniref:PfkB family carbohydrate kinase n=1 Tax=Aeromonas jandaei TaxID=650 RepID=UPI003EC645A7
MTPPVPTMPVMVIGAAFGDVMLEMNRLPVSGGDEVARESGRQIGGCAFNVARALARLGAPVINGITVGQGSWGTAVEAAMAAESLPVQLRDPAHDNGWCLALVEPDGERTFITVEGCEQYWDTAALSRLLPAGTGWVYASGYELTGTQGAPLLEWLLQLPERITPFIDPGPRIGALTADEIAALLARGALFSLNREEAAVLLGAPPAQQPWPASAGNTGLLLSCGKIKRVHWSAPRMVNASGYIPLRWPSAIPSGRAMPTAAAP